VPAQSVGAGGAQVSLRHAETLKPDGSLDVANLRGARATDRYTLRAEARKPGSRASPTTVFRYVELKGFPGRPGLGSLEGRVVHDDLKTAGEFACSIRC